MWWGDDMATISTLCTGGGGVEIGAMAAGLKPLWGIEHDDEIANVARANGLHIVTADMCEADPADYERPDVLHASPPCPNFSTANQGGAETQEDIALAEATARFIETLTPRIFTLENVYQYRKSKSWALIADTLNRCGYWYDLAHVNAADFGVPQTRKRMIVRAILGQMVPHLPPPEPWVGWYAAIEDLIPTLPESQFAPWQLERLDASVLKEMDVEPPFFVGGANKSKSFLDFAIENRKSIPGIRNGAEPMSTIPADVATVQAGRAFLASNAKTEWGDGIRRGDEPSVAVTEQSNGRTRAFLVTGQYAQSNDTPERSAQVRDEDTPSNTITASNKGDWKAFLVKGGDKWSNVPLADEPCYTVPSSTSGIGRAWLSQGRVVTMTPRALARFQSFPDWYRFSGRRTLDCRIIGNAVPPLLYQKIIEDMVKE
jgi:DNA-cytosine methyltransferase